MLTLPCCLRLRLLFFAIASARRLFTLIDSAILFQPLRFIAYFSCLRLRRHLLRLSLLYLFSPPLLIFAAFARRCRHDATLLSPCCCYVCATLPPMRALCWRLCAKPSTPLLLHAYVTLLTMAARYAFRYAADAAIRRQLLLCYAACLEMPAALYAAASAFADIRRLMSCCYACHASAIRYAASCHYFAYILFISLLYCRLIICCHATLCCRVSMLLMRDAEVPFFADATLLDADFFHRHAAMIYAAAADCRRCLMLIDAISADAFDIRHAFASFSPLPQRPRCAIIASAARCWYAMLGDIRCADVCLLICSIFDLRQRYAHESAISRHTAMPDITPLRY